MHVHLHGDDGCDCFMQRSVKAPHPRSLSAFVVASFMLGLLGFGGGWVVIADIRRRFVGELQWITDAEFVELTSVAGAMPGTTGPNLLTLIGHRLGGVSWACVGFAVFVTPGVASVLVLAIFYERLRAVATVTTLFDGMNAAVCGVVLAVAIGMRQKATSSLLSALIAISALVLLVTHTVSLLAVILVAGAFGVVASRAKKDNPASPQFVAIASASVPVAAASALSIFWVFSRIGLATFGGGYAMIPQMETELLARGWTDPHTFADAIALGQITPGPVALSGTFLGYRLGGLSGALAATLGMFLPPLIVCMLAARSLAKFKDSAVLRGFLAGIAPAIVGVIVAASWSVAHSAITGGVSALIAIASCTILVARPKTYPVAVLFGGALVQLGWTHFA